MGCGSVRQDALGRERWAGMGRDIAAGDQEGRDGAGGDNAGQCGARGTRLERGGTGQAGVLCGGLWQGTLGQDRPGEPGCQLLEMKTLCGQEFQPCVQLINSMVHGLEHSMRHKQVLHC